MPLGAALAYQEGKYSQRQPGNATESRFCPKKRHSRRKAAETFPPKNVSGHLASLISSDATGPSRHLIARLLPDQDRFLIEHRNTTSQRVGHLPQITSSAKVFATFARYLNRPRSVRCRSSRWQRWRYMANLAPTTPLRARVGRHGAPCGQRAAPTARRGPAMRDSMLGTGVPAGEFGGHYPFLLWRHNEGRRATHDRAAAHQPWRVVEGILQNFLHIRVCRNF